MGFKSLLLLIIVIFIGVFSIQNLQAISLFFFGFNSFALPLSIWMIASFLAGIISSLIIQLLTRGSRKKDNYNQSYNNPPPRDYSPSVSSSVNQRETLYSPRDYINSETAQNRQIRREENLNFTQQRNVIANEQPLEQFPINKTNPEEINEVKTTYSPEDLNTDTMPEQTSSSSVSPEIVNKPTTEDNTPSPSLLKSREASLYSYQPGEKTRIKITPPPINSDKSKNNFNPPPQNTSGVYDASYRVISPSQNRSNPEDDELYGDEDDEDWDF